MSHDRKVTLQLPPDVCQRLIERASVAGCTLSELVRRLVDSVPGQPDVITAGVTSRGVPAVIWCDGIMGGVWRVPHDP